MSLKAVRESRAVGGGGTHAGHLPASLRGRPPTATEPGGPAYARPPHPWWTNEPVCRRPELLEPDTDAGQRAGALDKLTSLLSTNGCLLMDDSQQNTEEARRHDPDPHSRRPLDDLARFRRSRHPHRSLVLRETGLLPR